MGVGSRGYARGVWSSKSSRESLTSQIGSRKEPSREWLGSEVGLFAFSNFERSARWKTLHLYLEMRCGPCRAVSALKPQRFTNM